jgi:hypothetical protein
LLASLNLISNELTLHAPSIQGLNSSLGSSGAKSFSDGENVMNDDFSNLYIKHFYNELTLYAPIAMYPSDENE